MSSRYDVSDVDAGAEEQPEGVFLVDFKYECHVGDLDAALREREDVVVDRVADELDAFRDDRRGETLWVSENYGSL